MDKEEVERDDRRGRKEGKKEFVKQCFQLTLS